MPRRPDVLCAGTCGKLIWRGRGCLPPGQAKCRSCRADEPKAPKPTKPPNANCVYCSTPFHSIRRSAGGWTKACSKKCNGHLQAIRDGKSAVVDQERRRAHGRAATHRRRSVARYSDISLDYERSLRAKAKRCPMPGCNTKLVDQPYLPASKELDHIVPLNAGGTHTVGNVRIICRACNQARPHDGSDYTGPVTLWALHPLAMRPTRTVPIAPPAKPTCKCGQLLTHGRCYSCQPVKWFKREWDYTPAGQMTPQERRDRALRASKMRVDGITWWEIARELRFANASTAWNDVKALGNAQSQSG